MPNQIDPQACSSNCIRRGEKQISVQQPARVLSRRRLAVLVPLAIWTLSAQATDTATNDGSVRMKGAISFGTTYAMDNPNQEVINKSNATSIGTVGLSNGGRNSDDSRLNYRKGDPVSTVLKGFFEADVSNRNLGLLVQVKAWKDFNLSDHNVPWGNFPSGYKADSPLSDAGFSKRASFSGAVLQEAYAYGTFSAGEIPVKLKLGNQLINWALPGRTGGALAEINPVDAPAAQRSGAFPEESRIPFAALSAQLGLTKTINVEAFYQFKFVANEVPGCGTYFAPVDFQAQGCNVAWVQTANAVQTASSERVLLPTGGPFMVRSADHVPSNSGEYGLGLKYQSIPLNTAFGIYYTQLHSRRQVPSVSKTTNPNAATPFVSGSPLNPHYYLEWPEQVKTLAVNFNTRIPDWTLTGELSYRPNDIFRLNGSDQLAAANNPAAITPLRADINALARGADWPGYDRHKQVQLSLGAEKVFASVLGSNRTTVSGEFGWKYVPDLPDFNKRRYGRPDVFGIGPVNGACAATANAKTCSTDGYVTKTAWGYRLRATLLYSNVTEGLDLRPSFSFGSDAKGTSTDTVFVDGRQTASVELRGEYLKKYFAELQWMVNAGGNYSMNKDKSYLNLNAGVRF
ncbi:MAG: DUF1302 domain-containing protein [Proteobacteria bacterium]|nr:DUF1302 domain-containing protein [Pseudomonadota bacterium]